MFPGISYSHPVLVLFSLPGSTSSNRQLSLRHDIIHEAFGLLVGIGDHVSTPPPGSSIYVREIYHLQQHCQPPKRNPHPITPTRNSHFHTHTPPSDLINQRRTHHNFGWPRRRRFFIFTYASAVAFDTYTTGRKHTLTLSGKRVAWRVSSYKASTRKHGVVLSTALRECEASNSHVDGYRVPR